MWCGASIEVGDIVLSPRYEDEYDWSYWLVDVSCVGTAVAVSSPQEVMGAGVGRGKNDETVPAPIGDDDVVVALELMSWPSRAQAKAYCDEEKKEEETGTA